MEHTKEDFFNAIKNNDQKKLKEILWDEFDPNTADEHGHTALDTLAIKGKQYLPLITTLLDYGADPNIEDENRKTIIEKLIDIELYITKRKKIEPSLRRYVDKSTNYRDILQEVIYNSEADLNRLNSHGEPYIFEPALQGDFEIIKILLRYGADINKNDQEGKNIIYKLMAQNLECKNQIEEKRYLNNLKSLVSLRANVNARDSYGGTTIHKAILEHDENTLKILVSGHADMDAVDSQGRNYIHNTVWKNKVQLFRLIYSKNMSLLNKVDKYGVLPIHYAAFLGYTDLVLEMLHLGAHVNTNRKKSPYILKFLKRFHKNIDTLIQKANTHDKKQKIETLLHHMRQEFGF